MYEEQRKLVQQQAQTKAQLARYEDELSRKRMQVYLFTGLVLSSLLSSSNARMVVDQTLLSHRDLCLEIEKLHLEIAQRQ